MTEDNSLPTIVAAGTVATETTIHRIGGKAGVQVTSFAAPVSVKRVTALNDAATSVTIHRDTLARIRELLAIGTTEARIEIAALLPE